MWVSLFSLLLIAGVAFFQSIHGLLSSLIFCVLTILCAALAFALYEYVAFEFLLGWKPDFALALSLALCFVVPLILTRVALDQLIRRASLLPAIVDRAGGIIFGTITALLIVGVLIIAIQYLPFGRSLLGFARFDRPPDRSAPEDESWTEKREREAAEEMYAGEDHGLWLWPDQFAVGLATMLSEGVFSGQRSFREDHPDLMVEIGWAHAVSKDVRHLAEPDAVQFDPLRIADYVYKKTRPSRSHPDLDFEPLEPKPGFQFWVATLTPKADTKDEDDVHRFTMSQIRLVGRDRSDRPVHFIPRAIRDVDQPDKHVVEIHKGREAQMVMGRLWGLDETGTIEVVFEVPQDFQPRYLAYKTGARVEVNAPRTDDVPLPPGVDDADDESAAADELDQDQGEDQDASAGRSGRSRRRGSRDGSDRSRRSRDRVSGARTLEDKSFFSDRLPQELTLTAYSGRDVELGGEALESGSVVVVVAFQGERDEDRHITGFKVPSGQKLLHLRVRTLQAGSTFGRALNFAVRNIRNYLVTDDAGKTYKMIGQYALADVDGDEMLEIQYQPEAVGTIGTGIGRFQEIKQRHLKQRDTTLVYLFLIDEGRKVVRFNTGSGANRTVDLRDEDLVAE